MAGAWKFFNKAKHNICNGTINLSSTPMYLHLYTTLGATPRTYEHRGSITASYQVVSGADYSRSGVALASPTWITLASAGQQRYDTNDPEVITASSTAINNIKFAVIRATGASAGAQHLLCYSTLTSVFNLAKSNTLAITIATNGIFTLA